MVLHFVCFTSLSFSLVRCLFNDLMKCNLIEKAVEKKQNKTKTHTNRFQRMSKNIVHGNGL